GRKSGEPLGLRVRKSILDEEVLALDPPELTEPFPERLASTGVTGGRAASEESNAVDLPHRLRLDGERRGEEAEGAYNEPSSLHARHPSTPPSSASAFSSQKVMPISRYIVAAVVRCSVTFAWSPVRRYS